MEDYVDVAIVGGGAAGLAAAIFCAERLRELRGGGAGRLDARGRGGVVVLDGAARLGAKILVSGGGRCNVTNERVEAADFQGNPNVVKRVLKSFTVDEVVGWFESMGVRLKREETGKLFPVTDRAATVLNALLRRCDESGVSIRTGHRVKAIERVGGGVECGFTVRHSRGELVARRVILATGGRSLPKTGSDGFGYELARSLGHTVGATWPALVPLVLEEGFMHGSLSGVSVETELSTFIGEKLADRRRGDLLWTHFGVSGPVVMDASRFWVGAVERGESAEVRASMLPGETFESVDRALTDLASRRGGVRVVKWLSGRMPARLAEALTAHAGVGLEVTAGQLPRERRRALAHAVTGLVLPVVRERGWNYAEVTAGGVPLGEVEAGTMASRGCGGMYLVGEILDCEGRIGGFNFHWAWATGRLAGRAAAESVSEEAGESGGGGGVRRYDAPGGAGG